MQKLVIKITSKRYCHPFIKQKEWMKFLKETAVKEGMMTPVKSIDSLVLHFLHLYHS